MKYYLRKENIRNIYVMILSVCFLVVIVFAANTTFARDKDRPNIDRDRTFIECNKEVAVTAVHTAAVGLGEILKDIKRENWRVDIIRSFISPIRFYDDKSGYFYVYDYKCTNIAHATEKGLEGKNLYNYRDKKGKFVIRELGAAAKKGGGFVEYHWVKPGHKNEFKKIGYVEPIPGTNYFIGTGVYVPDWTQRRPGSKR